MKVLVHAFFITKNCKKGKGVSPCNFLNKISKKSKKGKGVSPCFFEQKIMKKVKALVDEFF